MKVKPIIALGAIVAALAAPVAHGGNSTSYIGHPGGPGGVGAVPAAKSAPTSYIGHPGGPGGVGLVPAAKTAPTSYFGHPGGPGGIGTAVNPNPTYEGLGIAPAPPTPLLVTAPVVQPRGGFDWADAAVGGGFVGGLALLGAGAAAMLRRRGVLAAQQ